ncbi:allantoicase [Candidatus Obscuribacterales bacterium]|nr:allantoicase [Candidatus Obscuribacterales bacterium]MBX3148776.1 allantoicase [Candidatus Obscuribacterales bacterium]
MERGFNLDAAVFTGFIDLAAEKFGGKALACSDDFFAEMHNLLKPGRGVFIADKYTEQGKWMDGWESRRKRVPGHDWCIIKLGQAGIIHGVDIDTNHFLGNHPPYASIDALYLEGDVSVEKLQKADWTEILPKSPLKQGSQNIYAVAGVSAPWTHLRLNIYPDGGVARLKVFGTVHRNWRDMDPKVDVDLAAAENGGLVVAANDMFFGNKNNMIMPGRGENMGDGWETRRRRDLPGHDWAVIRLARPGLLRKIEVDTCHYKGNFPDACFIDGCYAPNQDIDALNAHSFAWTPILPVTKLQADHQHYFDKELQNDGPWSHIRLSIVPDGGISRFRAWCKVMSESGSVHAGEETDELKPYQQVKR